MSIDHMSSLGIGKPGAILICIFFFVLSCLSQAQINASEINPNYSSFGYFQKGDSVEFIFGQQKKVNISGLEIILVNRFSEINQVNLAGDFNEWSPNNIKFKMQKFDGKLFKITICKSILGKKGEVRQFKFVLNNKYWVEPPIEALNKLTGKDGNTNLTINL